MNSLRQHIPSFVDIGDAARPSSPFETTAELLALDVVHRWATRPGFTHFALSGDLLMCIGDEGRFWWVVGYLAHTEGLDLPPWDHGVYRIQRADGSICDISGDDVASSCGDDVTLRDGTVVPRVQSVT